DGRMLVLGRDKKIRTWETSTNRFAVLLGEDAGSLQALILSPDARFVLIQPTDQAVQFLEPATGKPLSPLLQPIGRVQAAALSLDGQRAVTASGDQAQVWSLADGKPLFAPLNNLGPVTALAI